MFLSQMILRKQLFVLSLQHLVGQILCLLLDAHTPQHIRSGIIRTLFVQSPLILIKNQKNSTPFILRVKNFRCFSTLNILDDFLHKFFPESWTRLDHLLIQDPEKLVRFYVADAIRNGVYFLGPNLWVLTQVRDAYRKKKGLVISD